MAGLWAMRLRLPLPQTYRDQAMIDLRSDTVTKPTPTMREAMARADVGDDVYGEDPTVNRLQAMAAEMLGFEAGLFVPSGTQSNLCALLTHCGRGDEYIVGQMAHTYRYEGGGAAVVGGIQPQPLEFEPDGTLDLDRCRAAIKPDDPHFARTRLLCLENTQWGRSLPQVYLRRAGDFARDYGLALHLDGARVFNACVDQDVAVTELTHYFDSVSVCLSKGLGAPVGSVLCGSREFIDQAHRWRKVLGGGMRQAGVIAAAGIIALSGQINRLAEDHANARTLAEGLAKIDQLWIDGPHTNMVFVHLDERLLAELVRHVAERGVAVQGTRNPLRLVTHRDISASDIVVAVKAFDNFFTGRGSA